MTCRAYKTYTFDVLLTIRTRQTFMLTGDGEQGRVQRVPCWGACSQQHPGQVPPSAGAPLHPCQLTSHILLPCASFSWNTCGPLPINISCCHGPPSVRIPLHPCQSTPHNVGMLITYPEAADRVTLQRSTPRLWPQRLKTKLLAAHCCSMLFLAAHSAAHLSVHAGQRPLLVNMCAAPSCVAPHRGSNCTPSRSTMHGRG